MKRWMVAMLLVAGWLSLNGCSSVHHSNNQSMDRIHYNSRTATEMDY